MRLEGTAKSHTQRPATSTGKQPNLGLLQFLKLYG
jgi:hypothetical protein